MLCPRGTRTNTLHSGSEQLLGYAPDKYRVCWTYVRLFLAFLLAVGTPYLLAADPSSRATRRAPSKETLSQKERVPLQNAGETQYFHYQRDHGSMYRITPSDGSPSYVVSESFLQITLGNTQVDSLQQAELLRTYPVLAQEMFSQTLTNAYPDATVMYESPFEPHLLETPDGTQAHLEQDLLAPPYVRVRLTSNDGQTREFSVARNVVEQLLEEQDLTDARLLQGLQSFPFRLPEVARTEDFARLSMSELAALVQQEPALQRYDFIRTAKPYTEGADAGLSTTFPQRRRPQATHAADATSQIGASTVPQNPPLTPRTLDSVVASESNTPLPPSPVDKASQATRTQQATLSQTPLISGEDASDGVRSGVSQVALYVLGISFLAVGIVILFASRAPHR